MTTCRKTNKNTSCTETVVPSNIPQCDPFEVCLGAGRTLKYDGVCFRVMGTVNIPNGTYTSVTFQDGCIVDAGYAPLASYTPSACAPIPGGGGSGPSGDLPISPQSGNLFERNLSGYGAFLFTQSNGAITFSGDGTSQNPLTASVTVSAQRSIVQSGSTTVMVTGTGEASDPYKVALKELIEPNTYNGFTVNRFGQITAYTDPDPQRIRSIQGGLGISVTNSGGLVEVDLKPVDDVAGTYRFGAYLIQVNGFGNIISQSRVNTLPNPGTYPFGGFDVTVSTYGDIEEITERADRFDAVPQEWVSYFPRDAGGEAGDGRIMQFTLPQNARLHVEYVGTMRVTNVTTTTPPTPVVPGSSFDGVTGARITVNGAGLAQVLTDTQLGFVYENTTTRRDAKVVTGCRASTNGVIPRGDITVEVYPPSGGNMVIYDGFIKVSVIGVA